MISWVRKLFSKEDKKQTTFGHKNVLSSCTTVVAIIFDDGVVLGADGRILSMVFGRVARNLFNKTLQVCCNAVGFSGNFDVLCNVKRDLKKDFKGKADVPFAEFVTAVRKHMSSYENESIEFSALVVGKDSNSAWSIVELKLDSKKHRVVETSVEKRFAAIGSGEPYVKKFITNARLTVYPEDSALEERKKFAFEALKDAVTRDHGTGGLLRVISIMDQKSEGEGQVKASLEEFLEIQPSGPQYCKSKYEPFDKYGK